MSHRHRERTPVQTTDTERVVLDRAHIDRGYAVVYSELGNPARIDLPTGWQQSPAIATEGTDDSPAREAVVAYDPKRWSACAVRVVPHEPLTKYYAILERGPRGSLQICHLEGFARGVHLHLAALESRLQSDAEQASNHAARMEKVGAAFTAEYHRGLAKGAEMAAGEIAGLLKRLIAEQPAEVIR